FFKILSRFFPEMALENCEWRSSLTDWPEIDAFLSIPRKSAPTITALLELFVAFVLESARVKKRVRLGAGLLDLALEFRKESADSLQPPPQKPLPFTDKKISAIIGADSLSPRCESVETLNRRKFQGLAFRVPMPTQAIEKTEQSLP